MQINFDVGKTEALLQLHGVVVALTPVQVLDELSMVQLAVFIYVQQ